MSDASDSKSEEDRVAETTQAQAQTQTQTQTATATNKSGRWWREPREEPARAAMRRGTPALRTPWEKRVAEKRKLDEFKAHMKEVRERKQQEREAERERRAALAKRRAENELGAMVVQPINPEKLKKMTKKQLRMVRKTRMGDDGVLRLVGAYE